MRNLLSFVLLTASFASSAQPLVKKVMVKHAATKAFSFVQLTDIHIGESFPDYGGSGFFDSLNQNKGGYPAERLMSSIRWLNENAQQQNIHFVMLTGDLTDSGEKSEFLHVEEMLDSLNIPVFPMLGNHDAWPYVRYTYESSTACGDSLMNEVFQNRFQRLKGQFSFNADVREVSWHDRVSGNDAYLQNFSFSYNNVRFVALDFNPRYHVKTNEPGIGAEVCLFVESGGTLDFLKQELAAAVKAGEKVMLFTHHPPVLFNLFGKQFAFSAKQRAQMAKILKPYRKSISIWMAGHIHRWAKYRFALARVKVVETKANKSQPQGGFTVVEFQ
jgi:3',5'-cyclic AMP phosphodiesterase CpdA